MYFQLLDYSVSIPRKTKIPVAMSATKIPEAVLVSSSDQKRMPVIGLGTAAMADRGVTKEAIIEAIKAGYRHFDTASLYGSEKDLGEAIIEALQLGLVKSRDELFITTKLWCVDNHPHLVVPAIQRSLKTLQLEYVDLYLVHFPMSAKPESTTLPIHEKDLVPFDMKGVWRAMEECQKLGLTKSIGVSNFSSKKLEHLLSFATIPPSVNQVEMNPVWQQKKLVEFCKEKGILITAYSPLGASGTSWGSNEVMSNGLLKEVADAHGKTIAQVCLRWIYEQDVTLVVKSSNKERMSQNLEIFDWSLTKNDYEKINQIKQNRVVNGPATIIPDDLWEGED